MVIIEQSLTVDVMCHRQGMLTRVYLSTIVSELGTSTRHSELQWTPFTEQRFLGQRMLTNAGHHQLTGLKEQTATCNVHFIVKVYAWALFIPSDMPLMWFCFGDFVHYNSVIIICDIV